MTSSGAPPSSCTGAGGSAAKGAGNGGTGNAGDEDAEHDYLEELASSDGAALPGDLGAISDHSANLVISSEDNKSRGV